jgi:predicted DNA-binding protein YlxM (UPF0122 family)
MIKIKISKEELIDLYSLKKLSAHNIANNFNCERTTIYRRLRKFGIPIRSISEAKKGNKIWLGRKHTEEAKNKNSQSHIGKKPTIETRKKMSESRRGIKFSLEHRRKIGESQKWRIGEKHSGWKGGSIEYYCRIARINYIKHYGKITKGCLIHHVDKNRKNNDISNLKMVTPSEHSRIHEVYKNFTS